MDVVVTGRRREVSERFRTHVAEKLERLEKFDPQMTRVDVEVSGESNPRLASQAERVELTVRSKGPIVRAEAAAQDRYAALDIATEKLEARLRKAAERRTSTRRHRVGVGQSSASLSVVPEPSDATTAESAGDVVDHADVAGEGPFIVREKSHDAEPMTLDDALYEMELVGHDFYLFVDAESSLPSVVYRRRGYDYGVIRLNL